MTSHECPNAGQTFEIRNGYGELIKTVVECGCPVRRCFACEQRLGVDGRCQTLFCFMDGLIVPIPVIQ